MPPRVFTIPPSAPFLPTLIEALTGGKLGFPALSDPLALAAVTLYLPTRRACRLARDAFLDALDDRGGDPAAHRRHRRHRRGRDRLRRSGRRRPSRPKRSLCRRRSAASNAGCCWRGSLPNGRARRRCAAREGMPLVAQTPAAACALADDLARLIDDMTMREVSWDAARRPRARLSRSLLAAHAEISADRARERGRRCCASAAAIEPAARRDALIKAEAARLARKSEAPVIAAGSTGSIPATAELIATIAHLPHGAVVLPGLDTDLDADAWRMIAGDEAPIRSRRRTGEAVEGAPGHPQFALQRAARAHRDRARRRRAAGRSLRPRTACFGSAAPGRGDRAVAAARRRPRIRSRHARRRSRPWR